MGAEKNKRFKPKERFVGIPYIVVTHKDFNHLGGYAVKLLVQAASQYNGRNNGKICFVWSQMKEIGWRSKTTLTAAKKELIDNNLLIVSKYGGFKEGKGVTQFYALTWQNVDEIIGFHMDIEPTNKPIRNFRL